LEAGNFPLNLDYGKTWLFFGTGNPDYFQPATYDPWSFHYEHDAVDQDSIALVNYYGQGNVPAGFNWRGIPDQGTDGFDNDGFNGVDDPNERETAPPYAAPLRGIRVSLRVNEPDTRQVKQMTVVQDFTPE
jgi:hypothetical protein